MRKVTFLGSWFITAAWGQPVYILCSSTRRWVGLYLAWLTRHFQAVNKLVVFTPLFHSFDRWFSTPLSGRITDVASWLSPLSTALIISTSRVKKNYSVISYGG